MIICAKFWPLPDREKKLCTELSMTFTLFSSSIWMYCLFSFFFFCSCVIREWLRLSHLLVNFIFLLFFFPALLSSFIKMAFLSTQRNGILYDFFDWINDNRKKHISINLTQRFFIFFSLFDFNYYDLWATECIKLYLTPVLSWLCENSATKIANEINYKKKCYIVCVMTAPPILLTINFMILVFLRGFNRFRIEIVNTNLVKRKHTIEWYDSKQYGRRRKNDSKQVDGRW